MIRGTSSKLLQVEDTELKKISLVLQHLDKVFRFSNVPEVKKSNTVLEHVSSALDRGNKILSESGYKPNDELVRDFNRSMLVHDVGEILGEFKTEEDNRIGNTSEDLDRIEYKLGQVAIHYGLVISELQFKGLIKGLKKELDKGDFKKFEKIIDKFLAAKEPREQSELWLKAYAAAESGKDTFLKTFVKLIDKLDGNKFMLGNAIDLSDEKREFANKLVDDQLTKANKLAQTPKEKYLIGTVKEKYASR